MAMTPIAIVLAAGQGTRMKSQRAKVLFELCGRPMLHHVLAATYQAGISKAVVVIGYDGEAVEASLSVFGGVTTTRQAEQRGTGDAVRCALEHIPAEASHALVLCGDTPLLPHSCLRQLMDALGSAPLGMLTCQVPDPTGYGRIIRDAKGRAVAIREHKDCSDAERAIVEVNPGMYYARVDFLRAAVQRLEPNNAAKELYFTDVVGMAAQTDTIATVTVSDFFRLGGVNDRQQLATAEEFMLRERIEELRRSGVTIRGTIHVDHGVTVEADVTIESGVHLRGSTKIGRGCHIDTGCVLTDAVVGAGTRLLPYSVITQSTVGCSAQIGPFTHVRPQSVIGDEAHLGNFVEAKKTTLERGAKANHLAYLGDGWIGEQANIGAGTIFCNYDGFQKHKTTIGKGAFIGSDSQLVAPVVVGDGAYVATGTCVTKDVPAESLAIARVKQENKAGYAQRLRNRLSAAKPK